MRWNAAPYASGQCLRSGFHIAASEQDKRGHKRGKDKHTPEPGAAKKGAIGLAVTAQRLHHEGSKRQPVRRNVRQLCIKRHTTCTMKQIELRLCLVDAAIQHQHASGRCCYAERSRKLERGNKQHQPAERLFQDFHEYSSYQGGSCLPLGSAPNRVEAGFAPAWMTNISWPKE